jgi:hypothetical protein
MPQRLLNAAVAFYQAASRCEFTICVTPLQRHAVGAPTVVNYALSIELYLKLLNLLQTGTPPRGHHLLALFDSLVPETRAIIVEKTRCAYGSEEDLRERIEGISKAFVDWRYAHEHEFLFVSNDHLTDLAYGLHVTLRRLYPDLVSCYGE